MAANVICQHNGYAPNYTEFVVDTEAEVAMLPTLTAKASGSLANNAIYDVTPCEGSICIVGNGGDMLVYMLLTTGWTKMS